MINVCDFIFLIQLYENSIKRKWSSGDRFQSLICDRNYSGTFLQQRPFSEDTPSSVWQSYQVQWDGNGPRNQLSPWEFLPNDGSIYKSEWDMSDRNCILCRLEHILRAKVPKEVKDLKKVNLLKEPLYCTVVAFPTSISIITERLRKGFLKVTFGVSSCNLQYSSLSLSLSLSLSISLPQTKESSHMGG